MLLRVKEEVGSGSEFFEADTTMSASIYLPVQLQKLSEAMQRKGGRRKVNFHLDNARPRFAKMTNQKLEELGWEGATTLTVFAASCIICLLPLHCF